MFRKLDCRIDGKLHSRFGGGIDEKLKREVDWGIYGGLHSWFVGGVDGGLFGGITGGLDGGLDGEFDGSRIFSRRKYSRGIRDPMGRGFNEEREKAKGHSEARCLI